MGDQSSYISTKGPSFLTGTLTCHFGVAEFSKPKTPVPLVCGTDATIRVALETPEDEVGGFFGLNFPVRAGALTDGSSSFALLGAQLQGGIYYRRFALSALVGPAQGLTFTPNMEAVTTLMSDIRAEVRLGPLSLGLSATMYGPPLGDSSPIKGLTWNPDDGRYPPSILFGGFLSINFARPLLLNADYGYPWKDRLIPIPVPVK